jgi:16S rRNA (cytosine1407-C5)-methyltransferase
MTLIHHNFIDALKQRLPSEEIDAYLEASQKPLKKSIALQTHKISQEEFVTITAPRWRKLTKPPFIHDGSSFYIDRSDTSTALWSTFLHQGWFFYIQEIAASLSAPQLHCEPWAIILDMAAAPWGKTSQLSTKLLSTVDPWLIVANDVDASRIKTLAHNLNKWWCYNTAITKHNGFSFGKNLPNTFDHVLLDAPCSGEGTRYKSDSALAFWKQEEVNKIAWTQFQLLVSAIKTTKPWWTIVYSTCTLNPYENEYIVQKALAFFDWTVELLPLHLTNISPWLDLIHPEFTEKMREKSGYSPEKLARLWPHRHGTWGFFIAHLRKLEATQSGILKHHNLSPKNQFWLDTSKALQQRMNSFLKDTYGIVTNPACHFFVASKENVYLTSPTFLTIKEHVHCEKVWIPVAKIDRNGYRPTHHLGNIFGHLAKKWYAQLTTEQAQQRSNGWDIPMNEINSQLTTPGSEKTQPYIIIKRNEKWLSLGKIITHDNILKNKFLK